MSDDLALSWSNTLNQLAAERDRARDIAAILEAQVARVAELHAAHEASLLGHVSQWCDECDVVWPCDTARAIGIGDDEP